LIAFQQIDSFERYDIKSLSPSSAMGVASLCNKNKNMKKENKWGKLL